MRKPSGTVLAVVFGGIAVGVVIVAVVIALAAGDKGGSGDGAAAAPTAGCSEVTTEELYVQKAYDCQDGTRVLTFATTQSRDDFLRVAESFGAVAVDKGATWARTRS